MTATTIDYQLGEVRRRIDRLRPNAPSPRALRHLRALQKEEAAVRSAARLAPDEVEEKLGRLKTRLDVLEHSLEADASADWATFAASVEAELSSWDTYLERLQTSVVTNSWKAREQAEGTISEIRARRIAAGERLAQAREATGDVSAEARRRVTAARDELEKMADELSAKLK